MASAQKLILGRFFMLAIALASGHVMFMLTQRAPGSLVWLGAATAIWPIALLLIKFGLAKISSRAPIGDTDEKYPGIFGLTLCGAVLSTYGMSTEGGPLAALALFYSLALGVVGFYLFRTHLLIFHKTGRS